MQLTDNRNVQLTSLDKTFFFVIADVVPAPVRPPPGLLGEQFIVNQLDRDCYSVIC